MFKSKIDFDAFDKHNKKVKDLEVAEAKNLSKASVKKIINGEAEEGIVETKAKFYLILDYFKDAKGTATDHFLGFGENKALEKHFVMIEAKSGKEDKRMSDNPKMACFGYAFVKGTGSDKVLVFEPTDTKIQDGKWSKILKSLKPFLAGVKTAVQIGDQIIDEKTEDDNNEVDQKIKDTKAEDLEEQNLIAKELEKEKAGGFISTTTFGHIKKKMNELKKVTDAGKRKVLMTDIKKLSTEWLQKHGTSTNKDDIEKKQTLTKLLENLNKQLEMSEGDELTLFYQKIVRDWKGYDKAMTDRASDPKKQLRHTKQIQANIIQWERLYLRKTTPNPKEVQMKGQIDGLKNRLEDKIEEYADLVNAQNALKEFNQIKKRKDDLFDKILTGTSSEYEKLLKIDALEKRIAKLKPQLN